MEDAFNLPGPSPTEIVQQKVEDKTLVLPPANSHKSVAEAIQHLNQLKAKALTYAGKDGMNPSLWLRKRGIDDLLRRLAARPSTIDVDHALSISFEEPNINLFTKDYAPKTPPSRTSRSN